MNLKQNRVVVTGLGVVSSIGIGWQDFWKNIIAGKSGISRVATFDTSNYDRHCGGEIKNFDAAQFFDKRRISKFGRVSQMAIAASKLAFDDSKLELSERIRKKMAVFVGTTTGEINILQYYNDKRFITHRFVPGKNEILTFPASFLSSSIAQEFRISGSNYVFGTACAAGNYALIEAFNLIKFGKIEYACAGGADQFSRIVFTGFCRLLSVAPEKCQPFDINRQGMLLGEGAGILILETLESAKRRGAKIYSEILGYGLSCDALHMTNPSAATIAKAIKKALTMSRARIEDVNYISAHGTGTKENDRAECQAIKQVFGKYGNKIPMSSIKSMLGHTLGASSALESIVCCLAIENGEVPPTINLQSQDPECEIDCVPNRSRRAKVNLALNNSLAFGGNNACVILKKIRE